MTSFYVLAGFSSPPQQWVVLEIHCLWAAERSCSQTRKNNALWSENRYFRNTSAKSRQHQFTQYSLFFVHGLVCAGVCTWAHACDCQWMYTCLQACAHCSATCLNLLQGHNKWWKRNKVLGIQKKKKKKNTHTHSHLHSASLNHQARWHVP